ncbi:MAG: histidine kinase [Candidatus Promineifilaceae bacterium]|nr:histidine kinase [Candidatus Promineifilaceae bacterium]
MMTEQQVDQSNFSRAIPERLFRSVPNLRSRLRTMRWLVPLSLALLVVFYEFGPTRFIHDRLGFVHHAILDTLVFGTIGPILVFVLITFVERWLEERETSDLQSQLVDQARADARESRQLCDDVVQILFSTGALIQVLKEELDDPTPETQRQIDVTERALSRAIEDVRSHLLQQP